MHTPRDLGKNATLNPLRGTIGASHRKVADYLKILGLRSVSDLRDFEPLRDARVLLAASKGLIHPDLRELVRDELTSKDPSTAAAWPLAALLRLTAEDASALDAMGVRTVGHLAEVGRAADDALVLTPQSNGFSERPSAPAELMPDIIGSIASNVRFATFVRDTDLRNLTFRLYPDCVEPLPLSGTCTAFVCGKPEVTSAGTLAELFTQLKCPVVHLGYLCGHRQEWTNLGTHLGEVVHSLSLAPGESRNIALVNWRRRQLTALEEHTSTKEHLTATFVQNRALHEITSAVAREHQAGRTQTESNTAVTSAAFVGAGAVVGGVAGGMGGAAIGGLSGLALDALFGGATAGAGTVMGTIGGGLTGAAVGGAVGAAAGGMVYSSAQALGMIEADTKGDRAIVAEVQQRISLSTTQAASVARSLWSTVVVEDAQAEDVTVTTSNITNYNHMHALNIEYFEVLQHYLTRIHLETVQPVLFLPFNFLDFTNFKFIRDYWDVVRLGIEDTGLRAQGDSYFVTEGPPEAPDLVAEPPAPTPPAAKDPPKIVGLEIVVLYTAFTRPNIHLNLYKGSFQIAGRRIDPGLSGVELEGKAYGHVFTFEDIPNAHEITEVEVIRAQVGIKTDVDFRVRIKKGEIWSEAERQRDLTGFTIEDDARIDGAYPGRPDPTDSARVPWVPVTYDAAGGAEDPDYVRKKKAHDDAVALNQVNLAAYASNVANLARFQERLQRLVLRRRHFFTRLILSAIEPQEVTQLLEALRIGHAGSDPESSIPLSLIADTVPLGLTDRAFVLKLKSGTGCGEVVARNHGFDSKSESLLDLLRYADATIGFFGDTESRAAIGRSDHVYVPTGGLFAESILGRANGAEYIDIERYFNWQDSPIPHQAPSIAAVGTDSRFQQGQITVHEPNGDLQIINPVALPDPTGMPGVLAAIQNPSMFRDMSKAGELAGIVGNLTTLAGQMGEAAATMTGEAAGKAMDSAVAIGKAASDLAKSIYSDTMRQTGSAFKSLTDKGAGLNKAAKLDEDRAKRTGDTSGASDVGSGGSGGSGPLGSPSGPDSTGGGSGSTFQEDAFRDMYGGETRTASTSGPASLRLPEGSEIRRRWRELIEFQIPESVGEALASRNMWSLPLEWASDKSISLDFFSVYVTKLPTVNGRQLTAPDLLEYIRQEFLTDLITPLTLGKFVPYSQEDNDVWISQNPVGAVHKIDLFGPDNAAVCCVRSTPSDWLFHTIGTPTTLDHPVSGQRMFGYQKITEREFIFFTQGADRATGLSDWALNDVVYAIGSAYWDCFRSKVFKFVLNNGGSALLPRYYSERHPWVSVMDTLRLETRQPI